VARPANSISAPVELVQSSIINDQSSIHRAAITQLPNHSITQFSSHS